MENTEIQNMLIHAILQELDIYTLEHYGLQDTLLKNEDFEQAWLNLQTDFAEQTAERLVATNDLLVPDSEAWHTLVLEASDDFPAHVTSLERMSLTVPAYVPYLVRQLAEGPRQMGEAITKLVVDVFREVPKPQGILERIESRLDAMESHIQALDRTVQPKA